MEQFKAQLKCVEFVDPLYGTHDRRPHGPPVATIIHTTGRGPLRRAGRSGFPSDPFEAGVKIYSKGYTRGFGPHFVVGQKRGDIAQTAAVEYSVPHTGGSFYRRYKTSWWDSSRKTRWWKERWPELSSPLEFASGTVWSGGSVNNNTVGIEVVPPAPSPREPWTEECWLNLVDLLQELRDRYQVPISEQTTLTHSDANPLSRSTRTGRPWDPSPQQWPGFSDLRRRLVHAVPVRACSRDE